MLAILKWQVMRMIMYPMILTIKVSQKTVAAAVEEHKTETTVTVK
jgi:hypothetical protein